MRYLLIAAVLTLPVAAQAQFFSPPMVQSTTSATSSAVTSATTPTATSGQDEAKPAEKPAECKDGEKCPEKKD